jgi:Spy/CpxP family protein refolding chaperone
MKYGAFAMAGAAVMAGVAGTSTANAQSRSATSGSVKSPASVQMIERRVAMLTSHLQLYSGQATKIRAILTQEREQLMLRDNVSESRSYRSGPGPRNARSVPAPEVSAITARAERDIEKVLDARQLKAYRALKEGTKLPTYVPPRHRGEFAA